MEVMEETPVVLVEAEVEDMVRITTVAVPEDL